VIGTPSRLRSIRKDAVLPSRFPIFDLRFEKNAVRRKWKNPPLVDCSSGTPECIAGETLLFIVRVKRDLKRVYRNGCRYNQRLNAETGGSKTPHTLGSVGKHIVILVLVVSQQETVDLVRRSRNQSV
jgi:hypothetical protein